MAAETVPVRSRHPAGRRAVSDVHVLWITAGLGCDGDSVSITAATQPSIEDVLLGRHSRAAEGAPAQSRCWRTRTATSSCKFFHQAAAGQLDPFVLVVEGSIPNEKIKTRGLLGGDGHRSHDRAADHDHRVDRSAGAEGAGGGRDRHVRHLRRHPRDGRQSRPAAWASPTTWAGTGDRRPACPIVNVPGCPVQPDNFMETVLYLLYQVAGLAPMIPLDDQLRPTWLFGKTVHEGCDRAGYYEQGDFADRVRLAQMHREARLLGAGRELQRAEARMDGGDRRLSERRRHLHRLHDARLPRQVHAVHGRAARRAGVDQRSVASTAARSSRCARSPTRPSTRSRSWRHPRPELTTGYQPRSY